MNASCGMRATHGDMWVVQELFFLQNPKMISYVLRLIFFFQYKYSISDLFACAYFCSPIQTRIHSLKECINPFLLKSAIPSFSINLYLHFVVAKHVPSDRSNRPERHLHYLLVQRRWYVVEWKKTVPGSKYSVDWIHKWSRAGVCWSAVWIQTRSARTERRYVAKIDTLFIQIIFK